MGWPVFQWEDGHKEGEAQGWGLNSFVKGVPLKSLAWYWMSRVKLRLLVCNTAWCSICNT